MNFIASRQNKNIKYLSSLLESSTVRKKNQEYVIEGTHLLEAAASEKIQSIFIPETKANCPKIQRILANLTCQNIFYITDQLANQVSHLTISKEILAIVKIQTSPSSQIIDESCILLDRVQDPGNVGTIIRTAAASGIKHVLLSSDCADVYMPKVVRATMGAHFQINLYPNTDLLKFIKKYPHNVFITYLNQASQNLYEIDLTGINAWIFGNEGVGVVTDFTSTNQDNIKSVHIPIQKNIDSLNVAIAAGICMFEQLRQKLCINNE